MKNPKNVFSRSFLERQPLHYGYEEEEENIFFFEQEETKKIFWSSGKVHIYYNNMSYKSAMTWSFVKLLTERLDYTKVHSKYCVLYPVGMVGVAEARF